MSEKAALRLPMLLVTGAGGFVMQNCIPVWLELGYRVIAVDQVEMPPQSTGAYVPVVGDAADPASVFQQVQAHGIDRIDAVIHAAAITADPETAGMTPEAHLRANLLPALAWLEWAHQHGVGRAIMVSSSAVYARTEGMVSEDQPVTPVGTYAVAKAAIEAHVNTLKYYGKRDVLTIRLGNIYGLNEQPSHTRPRLSLIGRMVYDAKMKGEVSITVRPNREWTFAPDIARATHALFQANHLQYGLYHVASGVDYSLSRVSSAIRDVLPHVQEESIFLRPNEAQRHGILENRRLKEDTGFSNWTYLADGIRLALLHDQPIAEGVEA